MRKQKQPESVLTFKERVVFFLLVLLTLPLDAKLVVSVSKAYVAYWKWAYGWVL